MRQRQVLITGGSGALGSHVARAVIARGAHATVSFVHAPEAEALEASLQPEDRKRLRLVEADATSEDAVEALVASMPRLEVLLHLVGGFRMDAIEETTLADWRAHHDLVLTSTFLCCKHALRRMREGAYGRIVTVGSRAVEFPMGCAGAYSAAKAGVTALTRVLAEETKGSDITANCVHPSIIDTPANRAAMGEAEAARWVRPERLAEIVAMLGSEVAGELRGACVPVYGQV
jgi:NAD(P)-dependent dehydrogenase (short-subunit alcohol dehydrogenase family)